MDISVKIATGDVATGVETPGKDVVAVAHELGFELRPMHPGIDDPELATYFTADAGDDRATAEEAAARLNDLDVVEGAYVSPASEPATNQDGSS